MSNLRSIVFLATLPMLAGEGCSDGGPDPIGSLSSSQSDGGRSESPYDSGTSETLDVQDGSSATVAPDILPSVAFDASTCVTAPIEGRLFTTLFACTKYRAGGLLSPHGNSLYAVGSSLGDGFPQPLILRVPSTGGPPSLVLGEQAEDGSNISEMAVDGTHVYFLRARTGPSESFKQLRVSEYGAASQALVEAPNLVGLALDNDAVYFARIDSIVDGSYSLVRLDKRTHAQTVLAAKVKYPVATVVDDEHLYVSSFEVGIVRVKKTGGPLEVVAAKASRLGKLVLHGDNVLWVDRGEFQSNPEHIVSTLWSTPKGTGQSSSLIETFRGEAGRPCSGRGAIHVVAGLPVAASPSPTWEDASARLLRIEEGKTVARTNPFVDHLGSPGERVDVVCDNLGVYVGFRRASY